MRIFWKKSFFVFSIFCITTFISSMRKNFYDKHFSKISLHNFYKKENLDFRLVTAFSDNHFEEAIRGCMSISNLSETKNWQNGFMIAYLLSNLTNDQLVAYKKACPFVYIRKFYFENYPKFFENLFEYRWKPIIIQEMVNKFKNILYIDSSIVFHKNPDDTIKDLLSAQRNNFSKCGMRQFDNSTHSIFAATNPSMYKRLKFDPNIAKHHYMFGAGLLTVMKNKMSTKIIKKWVRCANDEYCMAPPNSQVICDRSKLLLGEYGNCHRFDQSVLAILLVKECSKNMYDHYLETKLLEVKRL